MAGCLQHLQIGGVIKDGELIGRVGRGRGRIIGSMPGWEIREDGTLTEANGVELNKNAYVIINAEPLTKCGWTFDHWILQLWRTGMDPQNPIETTSSEAEHLVTIPGGTYENEWVMVYCAPVFVFNGTGLIMRDAADETKILRGSRDDAKVLLDI